MTTIEEEIRTFWRDSSGSRTATTERSSIINASVPFLLASASGAEEDEEEIPKMTDSTSSTSSPPPAFVCPLSHEIMHDPVITVSGSTYERKFIEEWLSNNNHTTDPLTNEELLGSKRVLIPDRALRDSIEQWRKHHSYNGEADNDDMARDAKAGRAQEAAFYHQSERQATSSFSLMLGNHPPTIRIQHDPGSGLLGCSSTTSITGATYSGSTELTGAGRSGSFSYCGYGSPASRRNSKEHPSQQVMFPNVNVPNHNEVESSADDYDTAHINLKRRKINLLLDQCEAVRFPFKKKLMLNELGLTVVDIPMKDLCGTTLGSSLHKLSLAGNSFGFLPPQLVVNLPTLQHLDLSQCELHHLPQTWDLPSLQRLNLSHNRLTEFLSESMQEGLPELEDLNMYSNKVTEIVLAHQHNSDGSRRGGGRPQQQPQVLSKLKILNLGYNDLAYLPDDLDTLKSLRKLKVMNNFLEKVPMRVCDMESLTFIDVSSNPVILPPIETCERGISSMKQYYHCLRMEESVAASSVRHLSNSKSLSCHQSLKRFGLLFQQSKVLRMNPVQQRSPPSSFVSNSQQGTRAIHNSDGTFWRIDDRQDNAVRSRNTKDTHNAKAQYKRRHG